MTCRIFIGLGDVAGYFSNLRYGFEQINIKADHFLLSENNFSYNNPDYFLKSFYSKICNLRKSRNFFLKNIGKILEALTRFAVLIYSLIHYDVFIFPGNGSFFSFYELALIKFFSKKVIIVYLGSDARYPLFSGRYLDDVGTDLNPQDMAREILNLKSKLMRAEKYADLIVSHTSTAQMLTKKYIRLIPVGLPININCYKSSQCNAGVKNPTMIKILHAPSRPLAKGSLVFKKLIDELRNEGYQIDYLVLSGVSNAVVMKELESCDFVIDELYSDVPLGMLATEAAIFAKPTIVGGLYDLGCKLDNKDFEMPPSLYVSPQNIKNAIRKMIEDHNFRINLGNSAREFVIKNWDSTKVADNFLQLIQNDFPASWLCDAENSNYYWGWGLSEENWRTQVNSYVSAMGVDKLELNHKPILKNAVLKEIGLR